MSRCRSRYLQLVRKFNDTKQPTPAGAARRCLTKFMRGLCLQTLTTPTSAAEPHEFIGQDSGDVFAMMTSGYNFDGTQFPVVQRLGDAVRLAGVSVPNFYGAHGYDPQLKDMSAIMFAAGPDVRSGSAELVHNIDVAPTIARILDVKPDKTVEGHALDKFFKKAH